MDDKYMYDEKTPYQSDWFDYLKKKAKGYGGISACMRELNIVQSYFHYYLNYEVYPSREIINDICFLIDVNPATVPGYDKMPKKHRQNKNPKSSKQRQPFPNECCAKCQYCANITRVNLCITDSGCYVDHSSCEFFTPKNAASKPTNLDTTLLKYYINCGTHEEMIADRMKGFDYWAQRVYDYMANREYIKGEGEHKRNVAGALAFQCWGASLDVDRNHPKETTVDDIKMYLKSEAYYRARETMERSFCADEEASVNDEWGEADGIK